MDTDDLSGGWTQLVPDGLRQNDRTGGTGTPGPAGRRPAHLPGRMVPAGPGAGTERKMRRGRTGPGPGVPSGPPPPRAQKIERRT